MMETLQRIAIAAGLALVLAAAGVDLFDGTPWFWCALALFWVSNWVERQAGFEHGVASGIEMMTVMTEDQRNDVIALVKAAQKEEDNE
jgi:hypothetical protein